MIPRGKRDMLTDPGLFDDVASPRTSPGFVISCVPVVLENIRIRSIIVSHYVRNAPCKLALRLFAELDLDNILSQPAFYELEKFSWTVFFSGPAVCRLG